MQRWSTRWKTRRWPWDSAVTVLITFAILLRAAEVRGGKKAKGSRGLQSPLSPPRAEGARARLGPRFRGNLSERLPRLGAGSGRGDPLGAPGSAGRDVPPRCREGVAPVQPRRLTLDVAFMRWRGCTGGVGRWKKYLLNRVTSPLPALNSVVWSVGTIFGFVELREWLLCSSSPSCG